MAIKQDIEQDGRSVEEEIIREPLLPQQKKREEEEEEEEKGDEQLSKGSKEERWMVYLSTFVAVCGSFALGSCAGYSSPAQFAIADELDLSTTEYSLFASILTVGAMIGAITSGPLADFIGRKGAMRVSSGFCAAGWLAIYFSEVPVFIAELAPKELRGALTTVNQLMICTGVSVAFIIGTVLTWRMLALTGLLPCIILLIGLFFIPESPRWLAKRGRWKDFEAALRELRGKNADIAEEAVEIQDYVETLERLPKATLLDLFQKKYVLPVTVGVGLMVAQQLGGINGIAFYASSIFETAGFPAKVGTISYAIVEVSITTLAVKLMDKAGRKPLLLVSASGLIAGCLLTALSFYLKAHDMALVAVPILAVTGILVYIGSFSLGVGAIPWVIMSEIFPLNIKGAAGSFATLVNCFGAWLCSYTFNYLMAWSSYGTFILYAVVNALSIVFVIKVVPETKGRSLEQIQTALSSS